LVWGLQSQFWFVLQPRLAAWAALVYDLSASRKKSRIQLHLCGKMILWT
jgi:hypothetical protein